MLDNQEDINDLITKKDFRKLHYSKSIEELNKWTDIRDKLIPQELHNITNTSYRKMIVFNCIHTAIDMYTLVTKYEGEREQLNKEYFNSDTVRVDKKIEQVQDKFDEIIKLLEVISGRANNHNIKTVKKIQNSIHTDLTLNQLIKIEVPRFELILEEAEFKEPEIKKIITYLKKALKGNVTTGYPIHTN